jgi:hypothetical protein
MSTNAIETQKRAQTKASRPKRKPAAKKAKSAELPVSFANLGGQI